MSKVFIYQCWYTDDFIEIESTAHEAREIEGFFFFSGVVGLIDATHVYIRAPEHDIDAYKKKFPSLGLQVKWTTEEPSNNYVKPI